MIQLDHVTITRGTTTVASQLCLEIAPGEAVAVIGQTASGKTAFVEAIAGVTMPTTGQLHRGLPAGHSVDHSQLRIGYAPADAAAWPVMRTDEFLEMVGLNAGLVGKPLRLAVTRGLSFAGCNAVGDRRLDSLSDGQRKQLLLAATLLHDPDLLVCDDPMRCLDRAAQTHMEQVVTDLALAGGTVVASLNDARIGCCWTRVLLLDDGSLLDTQDLRHQAADSWPAWSLEPLAAWRRSVAHRSRE